MFKQIGAALALSVFALTPALAASASKGKVLIIMSGADSLELKDGKMYPTGTYLEETTAPLRALTEAGYTAVFASPDGKAPSVDKFSRDPIFYGGDAAALKADENLFEATEGLKHPKKLTDVVAEGLSDYVGVFVPGGFAPLQDLVVNKEVGEILTAFHTSGRPTGLLCHGPISLISTMPNAKAFEGALIAGDMMKANKLATGWPYAGYRLTVFSSGEEEAFAAPQFGGHPKFFVSDALAQAGAHVDRRELAASNVVEDRELLTGQQVFSSEAFAEAFVKKLDATTAKTTN